MLVAYSNHAPPLLRPVCPRLCPRLPPLPVAIRLFLLMSACQLEERNALKSCEKELPTTHMRVQKNCPNRCIFTSTACTSEKPLSSMIRCRLDLGGGAPASTPVSQPGSPPPLSVDILSCELCDGPSRACTGRPHFPSYASSDATGGPGAPALSAPSRFSFWPLSGLAMGARAAVPARSGIPPPSWALLCEPPRLSAAPHPSTLPAAAA